jgi:phenylpropionate dioxygenase-like ring-hydroxylating dioxygenase large terminal subunit
MAIIRPNIDYDELVKEDRVHSAIYTSPEIFEEEMEKIFYRDWIYIGHSSEVPEPGDYVTRFIGRQPVIMTRDEDGQVNLLMNRCRHRGNTVCQYERGNSMFLRCSFHGWTYNIKGQNVGVTYATGYDPSFLEQDLNLAKVPRMAVYRGFVYGSMSPTGITLAEHLNPRVMRIIDSVCDASPLGEIEVKAGVHKTFFKGNWKFVGMDAYHFDFVHRSVTEVRQLRARRGGETGVNRSLGSTDRDENASRTIGYTRDFGDGHVALGGANRAEPFFDEPWWHEYVDSMEKAYGKERAHDIIANSSDPHVHIFPNSQILFQQVRYIHPVAADQTVIYNYVITLKGVPDEINTMRIRQHESFYGPAGPGSPDDSEVYERNQIGLQAQVNPWIFVGRGMGHEQTLPDGTIVGMIPHDEVPQRGQNRRWKMEMMRP